jgi:hypothetical protein
MLLAWPLPNLAASHVHGAPDSHRQHAWQKTLTKPALAVSAAFDAAGRLWRVSVQDGHVVVQYSDDKGGRFSPAVNVNPEPDRIAADGDNRPKIALAPDGTIYVSYTSHLPEPYSGHVHLSRSTDGGRSFSKPAIVNDDRAAISHRFESLVVDAKGRAHVVWLDRRDQMAAKKDNKEYAGVAVYYASTADGTVIGENRKLVDHGCECCRIALALDTDGTPVIAWRHVYDKNVRDHALWRLDARSAPVRVAEDNWAIDACPHHGPALAVSGAGTYHVAWFTGAASRQGLYYARAADRKTFSAPLAVGDPRAQPGRPALLVRGRRVYLAWKEFDGNATAVRIMVSGDDGATWSPARTVASAASASDHPLLVNDGEVVYLSWNAQREGYRLIDLSAGKKE